MGEKMRAMHALITLPSSCKLRIFRRDGDGGLKLLTGGFWYEDRVLNTFADLTHSMVTVNRDGDTATLIIEE